MLSRRILQRKKLPPITPRYRIVKRRGTSITYNSRDHKLTENQQAWARSLSVSLSGWHDRRTFYKTHVQPDLQSESQPEPSPVEQGEQEQKQKTWLGTDVHAQQSSSENADDLGAAECTTQHIDEAAAWAEKARLMHSAGSSNHIIRAWDPENKSYIRDYEFEAQIAALKAARRAASSDSDSDDDDTDTDGDQTDSDELDVERFPSPHPLTSSLPTPQSAPVPLIKPSSTPVDWRIKARIGVTRKKLSVTKEWGLATWNQKSNIHERLLVLEDDGVDIEELKRGGKVSSEEVTKMILERAANEVSVMEAIGEDGGKGEKPEGAKEVGEMVRVSLVAHTMLSPPPARPEPKKSVTTSFQAETQPDTTTPAPQPVTPTTQSFSLADLYIPQPSAPLSSHFTTLSNPNPNSNPLSSHSSPAHNDDDDDNNSPSLSTANKPASTLAGPCITALPSPLPLARTVMRERSLAESVRGVESAALAPGTGVSGPWSGYVYVSVSVSASSSFSSSISSSRSASENPGCISGASARKRSSAST